MRISIEIDKDSVIESSVSMLKRGITFSYRWLTNEGEALGYILSHIHFMLGICIVLLVIVSHIVFPSFWFQLFVFCLVFLVWLQHILLNVCVSIIAEKELTMKESSPYHELIEKHLRISQADFIAYYAVAETVALGCLAIELLSRYSMYYLGWTQTLI